MSLSDSCDKGNEIAEMHTYLVNRVGLHKCNGYCLRKRKRSSTEGSNKKMFTKYSRFHFGNKINGIYRWQNHHALFKPVRT